ncbi:MAG TPA: GNAT family N-acetyltransferase [Eudoraea sp.]|nr:GNAT family N-acetyltransferase [Eudoraea sp.]
MSTIKIRIAGKGDARYIALLGRITFTGTFGHLFRDGEDLRGYCEETFNVGKIETSLQKSSSVYWIAFSDRLPVGYAKLKLNSPSAFIAEGKICQLQKIYVLKDFLSLRVGFQLQEQMLQKAREYGYSKIWLSVLEENERATLFYKKNGFTVIGKHDFQIGKERFEFLAMSKALS